MSFQNTVNLIEKLCEELKLPYMDVVCYHGHARVFRHYAGKKTNGKEKLFMYSCSKPITCVAALRLCERGVISLDDDVSKYLPSAKNLTVLVDGEIKPCTKPLKIKHLFTMTSGLDYNSEKPDAVAYLRQNKNAGTTELCDAFFRSPLNFEPGTRYMYSLSHDVLAAIVEVASKKSFSDFVKDEIFTPLGMKNSTFSTFPKRKTAKIYKCVSGKIKRAKPYVPATKNFESGGAGLISCVDDYVIFADALACGGMAKNGYRLLSKDTLELMRTVQVGSKLFPAGEADNFSCSQGDDYCYGLGVRVRTVATDYGLSVGEFGWDGAACSYVLVDPVNHVSIFIGMHLLSWGSVFGGKHLELVESIYRDAGYDRIRRRTADEDEADRRKKKEQSEIDAFKKRYFGLYSDIKISHREDW